MIGLRKASPYRLAMHWGQSKVHLLLSRSSGRGTFGTLAARSVEVDTADSSNIANAVTGLLAEFEAARPQTYVALSRAQVDVFHVDLPPASPEEMISLVELHMMQHEPDLAQSAIVDFVPVSSSGEEQSRAIVFAATQPTLDFVNETVEAFGGKLESVAVRGLAAFSAIPDVQGSRVQVIPYEQEADLVFAQDNRLVTVRSIRLPDRSEPTYCSDLVAALRRSLMIAGPQRDNDEEPHIILMGREGEASDLSDELKRELLKPVTTVDPCQQLKAEDRPEFSGAFAPLAGMLLDGRPDASVNFLSPRKTATRQLPIRKIAIYAAAAILLLGMLGWSLWQSQKSAQEDVESLEREVAKLQKMSDKLGSSRRVATAIAGFNFDNVVWLDELRELSHRFPPADQAYVQRISMSANAASGNKVILTVRASDPTVINQMENLLRDEHHSIDSKRVTESSGDEFRWNFEAVVEVKRRSPDEYREAIATEAAIPTTTNGTDESTPTPTTERGG